MQASAENLKRIVCHLTDAIGVRLAGSEEERRAAEFLEAEFARFAPRVGTEWYPVRERRVVSESLEVFLDGAWRPFPCSLFGASCGTGGEWEEGGLVFFDTATGYQNPDISYLRGKAVVHLGCHIETEDSYRRLMEAKPAFLLMVDTRFPADRALADGLFPAYVRKYGALPTLNVAFQDAWKWKVSGAARARVRVDGESRESRTSVVVAELPGTDPGAGAVYAGGHHDTQAGTVGADDNALGSAAVVELARALSGARHRRTIRLISFGAEEQLSVGSAAYVRAHRREIEENGVFMCNFDAFGTAMGWAEFTVNATDALRRKIREVFNARGIRYRESAAPMPYTDQFPFAACGVPGIWIARNNCASGVFYHHRADNTPDKIDFGLAAEYVAAAADLIAFLADAGDAALAPFRGIPKAAFAEISGLFENVYGGF